MSQPFKTVIIGLVTVLLVVIAVQIFKLPIAAEVKVEKELHILFIGNSYTHYNDMPGMLVKIAKSDTENQVRFEVQAYARDGAKLVELWDGGEAKKLIQSKKWDYVILQEQSMWAMSSQFVDSTIQGLGLFAPEIRKASARLLLYATWARQPNSAWYKDHPFLHDYSYMQSQLANRTREVASRFEGDVVPVGSYWATALAKQPTIPLYNPDGSHPSMVGSYLTALVFYRYFSKHDLSKVSYFPPEITEEQASFLRIIASSGW